MTVNECITQALKELGADKIELKITVIFEWGGVNRSIDISGIESLQNSGEDAIKDLVKYKIGAKYIHE